MNNRGPMPTFGRSMLEHWLLDPECTYLNHGTVGAPPRRVLQKQQALRDEMERQPVAVHAARAERRAADAVAPRVAAARGERSGRRVPRLASRRSRVRPQRHDRPQRGARFAAARRRRRGRDHRSRLRRGRARGRRRAASAPARRSERSDIEYPVRDARRRRRRDRPRRSRRARSSSSSITSPRRRRSCCRWRPSPPNAARAACPCWWTARTRPARRPLDIPSLGVDWYAANLHKWAHAPRGCGILWAAPERQSIAPLAGRVVGPRPRASAREFEHTATGDPTSYLAAPEGIALLREWGFDACVALHARASPGTPPRLLTDALGHDASRSRATWWARWSRCRCRRRRRDRRGRDAPAPGAAGRRPDRGAAPRLARPAVDESVGADLQRARRHRTAGRRGCAPHPVILSLHYGTRPATTGTCHTP